MRLHRVLAEADALADHEREGESREARVDLDHGAAGEVDQPCRLEEAPAPGPVGDGVVDQRGPEKGEHDECRKPDPLGGRRGDHGERDSRERKLIGCKENRGIGPLAGVKADASESDMGKVADHPADIRSEYEGISEEHPLQAHECESDEREREHGDEVLLPDHAAVEEADPRASSGSRARSRRAAMLLSPCPAPLLRPPPRFRAPLATKVAPGAPPAPSEVRPSS